VTGQRSNQLNYVPSLFSSGLWGTLDFAVYSYCQWFRLIQPFPRNISILGVKLDSKLDSKQIVQHRSGTLDPEHLSMLRKSIITDESRTVSPALGGSTD